MTRLLLIVVLSGAFSLTIAAPSAFAVPGDPGGGGQGQTKPTQQQGDCAGGVPIAEQLCDALLWSPLGDDNPVNDTVDAVAGAPGAAGRAVGGGALDQVTRWMTDGARWVTSKIQELIKKTTTPELEARWYRERFAGMAALGGGLSVLVAMIALGSAGFRRDPDALGATFIGMFRAGIGTGIVLALVVLALSVADGITNWVAADASGQTASRFWGDVAGAWGSDDHAGFGSSAIAFMFAVVQVLAGVAVWIEMQLRQAGIYVAVLFMPAALAAAIWPRLRSWQERLVGLLFVMVAMKPVIVVVLSLAGSAAAAGGGCRQGPRVADRGGDDSRARGVRAVGVDDARVDRQRGRVDCPYGDGERQGLGCRRSEPCRWCRDQPGTLAWRWPQPAGRGPHPRRWPGRRA